jgi:hypothetical protein
MRDMLFDEQLLLGIAGKGKYDKFDKMYPLPPTSKVTEPAALFKTIFPETDHAEIVFNNPAVQQAQAAYEEKMNNLKQLFQMRDDYAQRQINQTRILAENSRSVFPIRQAESKAQNPSLQDEEPALSPAKKHRLAVVFSKKEVKSMDKKLQNFFSK